jgi:hypothetical protein
MKTREEQPSATADGADIVMNRSADESWCGAMSAVTGSGDRPFGEVCVHGAAQSAKWRTATVRK